MCRSDDAPDTLRKLSDAFSGRDLLRVAYSELAQQRCGIFVDTAPGDDERTEKIALSALIYAAMRRKLLRSGSCGILNACVPCFEYLRLEDKAHKIRSICPLHDQLAAEVGYDSQFLS